jgi:hypothetical protein
VDGRGVDEREWRWVEIYNKTYRKQLLITETILALCHSMVESSYKVPLIAPISKKGKSGSTYLENNGQPMMLSVRLKMTNCCGQDCQKLDKKFHEEGCKLLRPTYTDFNTLRLLKT